MHRRTWWECGIWGVVVVLQADAALADKPKGAAGVSCEEMLQASDAPRAVIVVRAAVCLMEQGKNAQAAQLLQKQLEQMEKDGVQGGRGAVEAKLQLAASKVAAYEVKTQDGTEITVDGTVVGKYPDTSQLFLDPGSHTVSGRKDKAEATVTVESAAGGLDSIELKLRAKVEPTATVWKNDTPDFEPSREADKPKPSGRWTTARVVTTIAGGVVGLGGIGMGIAFTATSLGYEQERADIVAGFPLGSQQCSTLPDLPDCKRVATLVQQRDSASTLGIVGFVIGGVGLATAITALVWPVKKAEPPKEDNAMTITILPLHRGAAMGIMGTF